MLPLLWREHDRLSVTDSCRWRGDDEISMRFGVLEHRSILLTFQKFSEL
jgi:hypothetical protein